MLKQHSVEKELKIFGEAGISAVIDELKQLHSREVLEQNGEMNSKLMKERMLCDT